MVPCFSIQRVSRVSLVALPFLILVMSSGCTDEYPSDMRYPPRDDRLLVNTITQLVPPAWDRPGNFPHQMFSTAPIETQRAVDQEFRSPSDISDSARDQLEAIIEDLFGTPQAPRVGDISSEARATLVLDEDTLARGSVLYRAHCLHCHGLTGNGRGPTAPWVNPHPRDYRQGIFKFTSIPGGGANRPRRADLLRTIQQGLEGTSMPSFGLIPADDQNALVSYVIHLSMRGNVEFYVMKGLLQQTIGADEVNSTVTSAMEVFVSRWMAAADPKNIVTPDPGFPLPSGPERKASVLRGEKLFSGDLGCAKCHVDFGRQSPLFYDEWGTIVRPVDLVKGVYRGGSRPIDLYWRIRAGINGANMPAPPPEFLNEYKSSQQHDPFWDVVNFIEILPYKKMREEMGIRID